ncbi:hypothetical protein CB0940_05835 [Cercospora beticola]|uniref:Uncharacterized protein n=1 Tax=Cercospora beticola TaxID=122368 RepID=A0A2G5HXV1_CERBT|nr:hypothetical protein CB0940_05835 [Cercospora beticola]PIA97358.1 hypothetical protein CB0940_05835 [Cercospora beticola]CAK1359674.1 unnamed protein product [Cercospora beticola]
MSHGLNDKQSGLSEKVKWSGSSYRDYIPRSRGTIQRAEKHHHNPCTKPFGRHHRARQRSKTERASMLLSEQSASDVLLHMELCHRTFHSALPAMDQADVGSHAIRLESHDTTSENSLVARQVAGVCEIGPDGSSPKLAWHADHQFNFARLSINDTVCRSPQAWHVCTQLHVRTLYPFRTPQTEGSRVRSVPCSSDNVAPSDPPVPVVALAPRDLQHVHMDTCG